VRPLLALALLPLLPACGAPRCDLRATAVDLAGPDAVDCGEAAAGEDTTALDACVAEQLGSGHAFLAITATTGIDSTITTATVLVDDHLWLLSQDSFGGEGGRIDGRECVDPSIGDDGAVACGTLAPAGNHYQVCGEWPGGDVEPLPFPG
jgi:hypothetical protein